MTQFFSSVSPKGQITIPLAVRRMLKLKPKDRVEFKIVDGQVVIAPARSVLAPHFRSIPPLPTEISDEDAIRLAVEEHVGEVAREGLRDTDAAE